MDTVMSAEDLVLTLSGEHLVTPALIVETIKDNAGLWATVKSYGNGNATYERVSESLANYL
jgi:hypothetical protein